jgi:hypothetical protein
MFARFLGPAGLALSAALGVVSTVSGLAAEGSGIGTTYKALKAGGLTASSRKEMRLSFGSDIASIGLQTIGIGGMTAGFGTTAGKVLTKVAGIGGSALSVGSAVNTTRNLATGNEHFSRSTAFQILNSYASVGISAASLGTEFSSANKSSLSESSLNKPLLDEDDDDARTSQAGTNDARTSQVENDDARTSQQGGGNTNAINFKARIQEYILEQSRIYKYRIQGYVLERSRLYGFSRTEDDDELNTWLIRKRYGNATTINQDEGLSRWRAYGIAAQSAASHIGITSAFYSTMYAGTPSPVYATPSSTNTNGGGAGAGAPSSDAFSTNQTSISTISRIPIGIL